MPRHPAAPALAGWYVISLRPSGGHAAVRRAAAALGARTFALSTLRLEPLPADAARRAAFACPWVIATSPAAVRFAFAPPGPRRPARQRWFAPGPGTAAALRRRGIAEVTRPDDGQDAAHLLATSELHAVAGRAIGLLTAPGGRDLLEAELVRRGARVQRADVYRRAPRPPGATRLAALQSLPARSALLVTSAEAFAGLWDALDARGREALCARPAIAGSARLETLLGERGFDCVVTAAGAQPTALLAALAAFARAGLGSDPLR
jgi:uroporphyrinogen-III synthase